MKTLVKILTLTVTAIVVTVGCQIIPPPPVVTTTTVPTTSSTSTTSTTSTTTTSIPPTTQTTTTTVPTTTTTTTTSTTTTTTTTTIPEPVSMTIGNATYAPSGWLNGDKSASFLQNSLSEVVSEGFEILLVNMGRFDTNGNLAKRPGLDDLVAARNVAAPNLDLVAWVNGRASEIMRPLVHEDKIAAYISNTADWGMDGAWINIEPFAQSDNAAWIKLLSTVRAANPSMWIAANAPVNPNQWTDSFINQIKGYLDAISPMFYDSTITNTADYTNWVATGTSRWYGLIGNKLIPSIPAYSANAWHDPAIENIATATAGMPQVEHFAVYWWWEFGTLDRAMWEDVLAGDDTSRVLADLADGYAYINSTYIIDSILTPPAGATLEFGPNGKFLRTAAVDGTRILPIIELKNGNNTLINPVIEGPNTGRLARTIDGITYYRAYEGTGIGGVNPNMEENTGIRFSGGSNYLIENPVIKSVWGDGINFSGASSNITVNNPRIEYVGRSLMSALDATSVTVNGGYGTGAFWWGINMETIGTRSLNGLTVNNMEIYYTGWEKVFASGTYFNCQVYNVDIELDLTAEHYDPQSPNSNNLRPQAVKLNSCISGNNIKVTTNF